jgi:hypothetical protein
MPLPLAIKTGSFWSGNLKEKVAEGLETLIKKLLNNRKIGLKSLKYPHMNENNDDCLFKINDKVQCSLTLC